VAFHHSPVALRPVLELIEFGFTDVMVKDGFNLKKKHTTEWRLSALDCDRTRTPASHAYRDWEPPENRAANVKTAPITDSKI
jgi:hypothetical protein